MDEVPKDQQPEQSSNTQSQPQPTVQPVTQPEPVVVGAAESVTVAQPIIAQPSAPTQVAHAGGGAGIITLQWLTYAFWGWTVLSTSILVTTVIAHLISGANTGGFTPYGIAAVLVLLPISVVCDILYRKHEPAKKTGAASIVMVIHAVLFALFGIGALIVSVIALVSMFTDSSDSDEALATLVSGLVVFLLYALTFVRTMNPPKVPQAARFYPWIMTAIVGVVAIAGIVGPVADAHRTKDDRLIEDNLGSVQESVTSYAVNHDRLPDSLDALDLSGDSAKVASLTTYTPNTFSDSKGLKNSAVSIDRDYSYAPHKHYYQLCVTYKAKDKDNSYTAQARIYSENENGYDTYLSTTGHPAGRTCYKLVASVYPNQ